MMVNNTNMKIITSSNTLNLIRWLDLAERHYENLVEALINNAIDTAAIGTTSITH
jgi:hypothetical protein